MCAAVITGEVFIKDDDTHTYKENIHAHEEPKQLEFNPPHAALTTVNSLSDGIKASQTEHTNYRWLNTHTYI